MSKVPYTIDVDRYICSELDDIRTMTKHLDFSRLPATIERIQFHASAMEDGLWAQRNAINNVREIIKDKDIESDEEKYKKIVQAIAKYDTKKNG